MTQAVNLAQQVASGVSLGFKNRIINGAMTIAQRGTTASNVGSSTYATLDRFLLDTRINASPTGSYTQAQSTDAPAGFNYSFSVTTTTAGNSLSAGYALQFMQFIEGYNVADLGWGTASAQTVTLSFWIKASIAGVYSVGIVSTAYDRSYVANYTVNSSNTWEYKTITIAGCTDGTWNTTTGRGMMVRFSLGSGSNYVTSTPNTWISGEYEQSSTASASAAFWSTTGATWKITGVQLEVGTTATNFEYRDYGRELALCYRYYRRYSGTGSMIGYGSFANTTTIYRWGFTLDIAMRTTPSISLNTSVGWGGNTLGGVASVTGSTSGANFIDCDLSLASGMAAATTATICKLYMTGASPYIELSAEL